MAADDDTRPLSEVLDGLRVAMVTTPAARGLTSRPLMLARHDHETLWFLVSRSAEWVGELSEHPSPDVQVSFADPGENRYVALTGRGRLTADRQVVAALWTAPAEVYFDGRDDPDAVALAVDVTTGEWWDAPSGRIGRAIALLRTALTDREGPGDHGVVERG